MLATIRRQSAVLFCFVLCLFVSAPDLIAQDADFQKLLESGEFSIALETAAAQTNVDVRDRMYSQIAQAQRSGDTGLNAFGTLAMIQDDSLRFGSFDRLTSYGGNLSGNDGFGSAGNQGDNAGQGGGITEQDFEELMDLIQETIDPDSWEENGGNGRMSPFPSGVWVDSSGTLKRIQKDRSGRLDGIRETITEKIEDDSLLQSTELRKVSLARLERELQMRAAAGKPVSADLQHLAGLYQLKYIILYPETGDVVIAGPAGPWHYDEAGRAVNSKTGFPVLNLDDLVVCLRNARRNAGQFSCSIDPREDNLVSAKQFVESTTLKGKAFRNQLQQVLGQMDVTVAGIDPATHTARVIVEADYRMKLIGLGVEPSVSGLKNYFERIHLDESGQLPQMDQLVRWWFTMNYDSVETNENRTVFELNGNGVKLLSESEFWNQAGKREHTGKSSPPAQGYADDFTSRFAEIAKQDPVFGQLKNVFDCAIAASVIHNEGLNRKINWKLSFLDGTARPGVLSYQVAVEQVPTQVDSILGQRVVTHRDGRRTRRHTISGFGGGVVFDASRHTSADKITVSDSTDLDEHHRSSTPLNDNRRDWSWD